MSSTVKRKFCFVASVLVLMPNAANSYELATHASLTQAAFSASVLADAEVLQSHGIDLTLSDPLGENYLDVSGTSASTRSQNDFEKSKMPDKGSDFLKVNGWLMRGAIREDDVPRAYGSNPQDDPYHPGGIFRVFSHFYDPVYNRPLQFASIDAGRASCVIPSIGCQSTETAPQWALGAVDVFIGSNTPETYRHNHFTVFDAREAMYRALTGRDVEGNEIKGDPKGTLKTPEDIRKAYWATTFRALGDVVHLVQDMAQPQHTRNDASTLERFQQG